MVASLKVKQTSLGPSPGARKYPDHTIKITPGRMNWTVTRNGQILAQSDRVWLLDEYGYDTVVYFPPDSVRLDAFEASDSQTCCPFKGRAWYLALSIKGKRTDVAWTYPVTYDEVAQLAGYFAFYPDYVSIDSGNADES